MAARLDHPAIVRVFDFDKTSHGDPFIVMDLLEGETLAALLSARGRVAPVKAAQLVLPVLDALALAHARGIVHRALKPESILLAREAGRTQPKIVDFGTAKTDLGVNKNTGARPGSAPRGPAYMAPEQASGSSTVDARADVWAVCGVLSVPPPPESFRPGSQSTMATVVRPTQPQPFRAPATFIATVALLILGATVATVAGRRHASAIGSSPSPLPNPTLPSAFEPTTAATSASPRKPASAVAPVETLHPSSVEPSTRPKPAVRRAPVPKKTKASANGTSRSDLKDPY